MSVAPDTVKRPMTKGLIRRDGRYSIRRIVPKDLQDHYGCRAIVRALGTSDFREAKVLHAKEWVSFDDEFADLRKAALKPPAAPPANAVRDPVLRTTKILTHLRKRREEEAEIGRLEFFMEDQRAFMEMDQEVSD